MRLHGRDMIGTMAKDFVDEVIRVRSRKNPRFPDLVAEAERRRALARQLAARLRGRARP